MASGKSLELAKIKPQSSPMCTCGLPFNGHMRKDGKGLLKRFDDGTHEPMTAMTNRAERRARRKYRG